MRTLQAYKKVAREHLRVRAGHLLAVAKGDQKGIRWGAVNPTRHQVPCFVSSTRQGSC